MANAPMVARLISRNSLNTLPLGMLSTAALTTFQPTSTKASPYQAGRT